MLNNMGYYVKDKLEFLNRYKFTIAFENASYPGYTTEKIFDPMMVNSIPVYWGNPLVEKDFNTQSFINWHEYGSDEAVIEKIIEIDNNEELYKKMLCEPYFPDNQIPAFIRDEQLIGFFNHILQNEIPPIASTLKGRIYKHTILDTKYYLYTHFQVLWKILYKARNFGKYGK